MRCDSGITGSDTPLVSVIVSTYDADSFLAECLDDLLAQTVADQIEIIVVDAASPGREGEIVRHYQRFFPRLRYIRTSERIGIYGAWNRAITVARGEYLFAFSTNDRLAPDGIQHLLEGFGRHPDVMLTFGDSFLTRTPHQTFASHHRTGFTAWPDYTYVDHLTGCRIGPHPLWRRTLHDLLGLFDESLKALGDQDMWLAVGRCFEIRKISAVTGLYWMSDGGISNRTEIVGPEMKVVFGRHASPPLVSIVIPTRGGNQLMTCVDAVIRTTVGLNVELVVIDDGAQIHPPPISHKGRLIRTPRQLGFAGACNVGARRSTGRHIVFLNDDTIPHEGWLPPLIERLATDPSVGIVSPRLVFPDGTIQHIGKVWKDTTVEGCQPFHLYYRFPADSFPVTIERNMPLLFGACIALRRSDFEQIGMFDTGYWNGWEDDDLCCRFRQAGFSLRYVPSSVVTHLEGMTLRRVSPENRLWEKNRQRFMARWGFMVDRTDGYFYEADGFEVDPDYERLSDELKRRVGIPWCKRG